MADYYVNGFTPPRGVNNADAVRKIQNILRVKADGIWGPQTQTAWERQDFARDLTSESAARNESAPAEHAMPGYTPPRGVTDKYKVKTVQANLGVTQDGVWGPQTQAAWERLYGNLWQDHISDAPKTESGARLSGGTIPLGKNTEKAFQQSGMSEQAYSAWLARASLSDVDEYYDNRIRELYEQNIPLRRFIVDKVVSPGFSLQRESAQQQYNVRQLLKEKEAAKQAVMQRTEKEHPSYAAGDASETIIERFADFLWGLWYNDGNNDDDVVYIQKPTPSPTPKPTPSPTPRPTPRPTPTPPPPLFEIPAPPSPEKQKNDGTFPWKGEAGVNHWNTLWNRALEELTEYVPRNDAAMTQEQRMNVILNAVKYIGPSYPYGSGDPYQEDGKTYYPIDCSGLARRMYSEAGINVFDGARSARFARTGKEKGWYTPKADMDTSTLYPGDLVIWEKDGIVGHVGVYLCTVDGQRWIIESTTSQKGPNVSTEWNKYSHNSDDPDDYDYLVAGYIVPEPNK